MESSRNADGGVPRPRRRREFTPDALARVLRDEFGWSPDVPLYVAYSGGMDSHVLLHALCGLRAHAPWSVTALHIDHGLQADSERWAQHCADVCAALRVPYRSARVTVRDIAARGMEDAARRARYAALAELLPMGAMLLTAHHRSDQAETLILQLLRGTGVPGLAAMPPLAAFGRGRLARPLLDFGRATLARYAAEHDLRWIDDPSNFDAGPARNFLRQRLWPVLSERWPQADDRFAATAGHLAEASRLLDELGEVDRATCAVEDGELKISTLQTLSFERQTNLLRYWVRRQTGAAPPESALRELMTRLESMPRTRHATVSWAGIEVRRYRDRLSVAAADVKDAGAWEIPWDLAGELEIPGVRWHLRACAAIGAGISQQRIAGKHVSVRARRGGEVCRLRGHRRSVKKLLQEAGIPPWERCHWPLVYADGDLVSVGDRWVCEPFAAAAQERGWVLHLQRDTEGLA